MILDDNTGKKTKLRPGDLIIFDASLAKENVLISAFRPNKTTGGNRLLFEKTLDDKIIFTGFPVTDNFVNQLFILICMFMGVMGSIVNDQHTGIYKYVITEHSKS